jgi:hypothetical protein
VSRYDLFRKRIAPVAFFLAIALIARDTCNKEQRTHATVELRLAGDPRAVDVDVVVGGATVAKFHQAALPDRPLGRVEFKLSVPEPDGELRIDVDRGAARQRVVRHFHAVEDSTMLVDVAEADR